MPVSVPIAGLLASLGIYGVIMSALALGKPDRLGQNAQFQSRIEWIGVLCISLFGMVGVAVTLAVAGGRPLTYLASTLIVGVLGVGFFKMLEITPTPLFAFLIDTRHFGKRRRRHHTVDGLKQMWEESSIDGNVLQHQEETLRRRHARKALSGALALASLISIGNAYWLLAIGELAGIGSVGMLPLVVLWVCLAVVLTKAGKRRAERAPGIDWRRPF